MVIQIGSLAIMQKWIILGISLGIGLILLKIWLSRNVEKEVHKKLFNNLSNCLFLGFFIWKGSLFIFEPKIVIESPLSLLYFTGGSKGLILSIILVALYYAFSTVRMGIPRPIMSSSFFLFSFTSFIMYHFFSIILQQDNINTHVQLLFVGLILLGLLGGLKMRKNILVIAGLVGLLGWAIYDSDLIKGETEEVDSTIEEVKSGIQEGNRAIDFELATHDGTKIKLSDLKGKKVILNFWATWCPPCKAEMPHMQDFYEEQAKNNIEILAVNLTTAEKNRKDIKPFVEDYRLTFPILLDEEGEIGDMYQAFTIPTSYIIDTHGIIRKKIIGPMDKEMMKELMESIN